MWAHLPGPVPVRLIVALAMTAAAVLVLFFVIFPAVDPHLPFNHVTVDPSASPSPSPSGG